MEFDTLKTHGSKVMARNTFNGDPRPSLWRAQAGRSQVKRQVSSQLYSSKSTSRF